MQGMTVTPPPAPYTKRTDTRNIHRADGEWVRDQTCPVVVVKGGELRYGVVVDGSGQGWGRWVYMEVK